MEPVASPQVEMESPYRISRAIFPYGQTVVLRNVIHYVDSRDGFSDLSVLRTTSTARRISQKRLAVGARAFGRPLSDFGPAWI